MDDAFGVGDVERICNLNPDLEDLFKGKWLAVNVLAQCLAVDEFHGDERPVILFANVVDGADAGMVQRGRGVGFAAKTFQRLRVLHHVIRQKFQRDGAIETRVEGFVDHTHSTSTEFLYDTEVRDGLVNHR